MLVTLLAIVSTALGEYTQVSSTEILFECWPSLCSPSSIGDSECDLLCMSPMCNYDSIDSSSGSWKDRFGSSDCSSECENSGCDVDTLGDGFCDESCNSSKCGFDLGDCAYCDADCSLEDLKNNSQDDSCNSPRCRFDNNMFGWCAEGCFEEDLDSDFCPAACKDPLCSPLTCCPENCNSQSIGDGICNQDCIYESCNYDDGDCDCSPGCSSFFNKNRNTWFSMSECSEECMNPSCLYNYPFACTNQNFIEVHLMHHVQEQDFNAGAFEETPCDDSGCTESMRTEIIENGSCDHTECNNAECIDCLGYTSDDCQDLCTHCSANICYRCSNTMLDFTCVDTDKCPSRYMKFDFISGLRICIPMVDTSTAEEPYYIYVGETVGESNSSEDGSQDSPYSKLEDALAAVWANYTVIKLLDGEFYYSPLENSDKYDLEDVKNPLFRSESSGILKEITIEGSDNSVVFFHSNHTMVIQARAEKLIIKNIEFSAKYFLEGDCDNENCRYCRYFEEVSGELFDDRRNLISDSFSRHCSEFKDYTPIIVESYSKLEIHDCSFKEFRFQSKALISSNSEVYLKNVKFYKVQAFEAVILLNTGASLVYEGGSVEYLNDGYEVSVQMDLKGFVSGSSFKNAHFYNILFEKNIVLNPGNRDEISLFSFIAYKGTVIFHQCNFTNLYVKNLIYIDMRTLIYEVDNILEGAYSQYQLNLTDTEFTNIYTRTHLIQIRTFFESSNVLFNTNSFENIYSEKGVVLLEHSGIVRDDEINGEDVNVETENNSITTVSNPPRTIELYDLTFSKTYYTDYIIYIKHFPILKFDNIAISYSGDNEGSFINDEILSQFINDPSYVSLELELTGSESVLCLNSILIEGTYSFEIDKIQMNAIDCNIQNNAVLGIKIQNTFAGTNNLLRELEILNIHSNSTKGSIIHIENYSEITLTDIQLADISGDQLYLFNVKRGERLVFEGLLFENFESKSNGAMMIQSVTNVKIKDSTLNDISTESANGGFLNYRVPLLTSVNPSLTIENSNFVSCITESNGGAVYISSEAVNILLDLNISNCYFESNSAKEGSAIYIGQEIALNSGLVSNCTFLENYTDNGGVIQDMHFAGEMNYTSSEFKQNTGYICGIEGVYASSSSNHAIVENLVLEENKCSFTTISFISLSETAEITIKSCNFTSNSNNSINIEHILARIEDCNFYSEAIGLFVEHNSSFNGKRLNFIGCLHGILCEHDSFLACDYCIFTRHTYEPIIVSINSYASISNSQFVDNILSDSSVINIDSSDSTTTITNSQFLRNAGDDHPMFFFVNTYVNINNCVFDSNRCENSVPGVKAALTTITIRNTEFKNQASNFGSFLVVDSGTATIENCTFLKGTAEEYAAAISGQSSTITIIDSTFDELSSTYRGCITVNPNNRLEIRNSSILNSQSESMIYANGGEVVVDSLTILNCERAAIQVVTGESFTVNKSRFEQINSWDGCLYASQTKEVAITYSNFSNLYSTTYGAGINLIVLTRFETIGNYTVESCNFSKCLSENGGAIHAADVRLNITNSSFASNKASTYGGAIYFECPKNDHCSLGISNSSFTDNSADYEGGALKWVKMSPLLENNTYDRNSAEYGNDIASSPTKISSSARLLSESATLTNLAPGQLTDQAIVVILKDEYDNTVLTDNSTTAALVTYDPSIQLSGVIIVNAVRGTYTFDEFIIGYTPGSTITLGVVTDAMNTIDLTDEETEYVTEIQFEVELRDCVIGEENTGTACNPCEEGEYSLDPSQLCQSCPSQAVCPGLWEMYPKKKYWRTDELTVTFYECPNTDSCLGGEETLSYTGTCAEGYKGNMCQSCVKGYSRTSKDTCGKCPDHTENAIYLILILIGLTGFAVFLVRSSFKSAYMATALHSIYLKIMMNYIQLVFLTTEFKLAWPKYVLELFDVQESTATISEQIFSIDCYVGDMYDESEYENVYYAKLIFMSLMPFIMIIVSCLVWYIIGKIRKNLSVLKKELICTIIVLFFFFHPIVTKRYFSVFSCREIEGQGLWLVDNLDIKCWDDEHSRYAFGIALPSLIVWSIGIPIFTLFFMYRRRKELYMIKNRIRFGFLFNGFRDNRYYWEFVILYRKMMIITLSVFLSNVSIPIQALSVLLLLFVSLYLHYRYQPFGIDHLNMMESSGILVATITIYCGLYYLTDDLDETSKIMFFILMIVFNAYFLCYWIYYMFKHIIDLLLLNISFLKKRYMKKDGFSEDGLQKAQFKRFSFSHREHKYYTLVEQTKTRDLDKDIVDNEVFKSVISFYMDNVKSNCLEDNILTSDMNCFTFSDVMSECYEDDIKYFAISNATSELDD